MIPSRASFASELTKLGEDDQRKPGLLRRLLPAALGLAAGAGAYKYLRKIHISDNPALAQIQRAAKGRLTHIEELAQGEKAPGKIKQLAQRFSRGADEVISEPYKTWAPKSEMSPEQLKRIKTRRVDGAMLPFGGTHQSATFKSDFNLNTNPKLSEKMEDKLREAAVLRGTTGGAPRSERLSAHVKPGRATEQSLDALQAKLLKKYPEGYVVKPVNDAASGGVPTHADRFASILKGKGPNENHKEWMKRMMKSPEEFMVQAYIPISKTRRAVASLPRSGAEGRRIAIGAEVPDEWRIHTANGVVIPGSGRHRWAYSTDLSPSNRKEIAAAEQFMQRSLDEMPNHVRRIPMAADVVRGTDGKLRIMELNSGGQSGLLAPGVGSLDKQTAWNHYKSITGRHSHGEAGMKGLVAGAAAALAGNKAIGERDSKS